MLEEIVKRGITYALISDKGEFIKGNIEFKDLSELMKAFHIAKYVLTTFYADSPRSMEIELETNGYLLLYLYKKGMFILFHAKNREERAVVKKYFEG